MLVRITLKIGKSFGVFGVYGGFLFTTFYILMAISTRDIPLNLVVSIAHYAEDDTWTIRLLSLDRQTVVAHALVLHELRANLDAFIEYEVDRAVRAAEDAALARDIRRWFHYTTAEIPWDDVWAGSDTDSEAWTF